MEKKRVLFFITIVVVVIILLVGIALIVAGSVKLSSSSSCTAKQPKECELSSKASSMKLQAVLNDVKKVYEERFPLFNDHLDLRKMKMFDLSPETIKAVTDDAAKLLKNLPTDLTGLTVREANSVLKYRFFLEHQFGMPLDYDFYNGLWMLSPNMFCTNIVCYAFAYLNSLAITHAPTSVEDVNHYELLMDQFVNTLTQYISNVRLGVKKGFVRARLECQASIEAVRQYATSIYQNGVPGAQEDDVTKEYYKDSFYASISNDSLSRTKETLRSVKKRIQDKIETAVVPTILTLLRFLEGEHLLACRPDDTSSGLADLPIHHLLHNGSILLGSKTQPYLPLVGQDHPYYHLNGSRSYSSVMMHYTTTRTKTPKDVYELGWAELNNLFPQVKVLAASITGKSEENASLESFKLLLGDSSQFYNKDAFPDNESSTEAQLACTEFTKAKVRCPSRMAAMERWIKATYENVAKLSSYLPSVFFNTGNRRSTPSCPVKVDINFNPSTSAQSYSSSGPFCKNPSKYYLPFWLDRVGPVYSDMTINAHEAHLGHHTQVQGFDELFQDACDDIIGWVDNKTNPTAFSEGWGLYAENPLAAQDLNLYKNEPMQRYGMLKWQIWRALRLIVDPGLGYFGYSRTWALDLYGQYAFDRSDAALKEIVRYSSYFGQATAYTVGQAAIRSNRKKAEDALGSDFSLPEFHYHVLSQGSSPLQVIDAHVDRYINCKKSPQQPGCAQLLDPKGAKPASYQHTRVAGPRRWHYI